MFFIAVNIDQPDLQKGGFMGLVPEIFTLRFENSVSNNFIPKRRQE